MAARGGLALGLMANQISANYGFCAGHATVLSHDKKVWYRMASPADFHFERGDALEEQGSFEQAFEEFTVGAKAGDVSCMTRLAMLYTLGKGIACCDYDQAIEWEKKAYESGSTLALFNLGITYRMKGDLLQARACFEKALSAGDNSAALELAKLYVVSPKESDTVRTYLSIVLADHSLCEEEREEAKRLISRI